jgi:hypothetical protein
MRDARKCNVSSSGSYFRGSPRLKVSARSLASRNGACILWLDFLLSAKKGEADWLGQIVNDLFEDFSDAYIMLASNLI